MIRYALVCPEDHAFESWFRDSEAFDALALADQLACPVCGASAIRKALMAPSVVTSRRRGAVPVSEPSAPTPAPSVAPVPVPAPSQAAALLDDRQRHVRALMRALHREITEKADNVGRAFAVEARRIHEGDAAPRSIYGEASPDEVEDLIEDGVPLMPMPIPPDDHN